MAKLIPKIHPNEIENPGERKIAIALIEQLPTKVEVFHSFQWLDLQNRRNQNYQNQRLQQGECDFVILHPDLGLLFIEVKGGMLTYDAENFQWFRIFGQEKRVLNKDPFDQVRDNMYVILKHVQKEYMGASDRNLDDVELPFTRGYAVAFPDGVFEGQLPPNMHSDIVIDAMKCEKMGVSIDKIFERFRYSRSQPLSGQDITKVHRALMSEYRLFPVIWRKVEDWEYRIKRLTEAQQNTLTLLSKTKLAAIEGMAGSGKTILALAKAQSLAKQGHRTLLVCFNYMLRLWFDYAMPDEFKEMVTIDTYHGMVEFFCKKANIPFLPDRSSKLEAKFWQETAPEKLMEATEILSEEDKYDAVVVDEGQDFNDLWWTSLDGIFRDPENKSSYYVFYDPYQNIREKELTLPEGLPHFVLGENCRNTICIAEHCAKLIDKEPSVMESAPVGEDPSLEEAANIDEAFRMGVEQVRQWCLSAGGGLKPSQVVMFAPSQLESKWPEKIKTLEFTKNYEKWREGKGVLVTTWGRFKGLEADAIVIIESPQHQKNLTPANRYVARSRAKHLLALIQVKQN
jgi:hypothetical protein